MTSLSVPQGSAYQRQKSPGPPSRAEERDILFAVPKKGRIHNECMKLLEGSGLEANRPERLDVAQCKSLPVKLVFLPASDIPMYVMDGNCDLGITGRDMLEETLVGSNYDLSDETKKPPLRVIKDLGFGKCKLCLQAPVDEIDKGPAAFAGKRIVTSFPALTKKYFDSLTSNADHKTAIKVVSGSVEAACGLGLADAIVDLVETGTTMRAAGLEVVSEIFASEAIIMQQEPTEANGLGSGAKGELIDLIMKRINGYFTATKNVMIVYNCTEKDLTKCCQLAPGKRSPTITKLQEEGWCSVSVLVEKSKLHKLMDELTVAGATDILVTSLANTRM